jgi:asparagine synthase (glutamine-hydrolysing)
MCGIVGFTWSDKSLLKQMMQTISHRGPDDQGFYHDEQISLGHQRLSILDLSKKGHQPMLDSKKELIISFNGEIYNYLDLKKKLISKGYTFKSGTDTEVILYGYREYGQDIVKLLEGMFAFAIWDKRSKELFIARDHIGEKPLYYWTYGKNIVFASEIKAILKNSKYMPEVNLQCLSDFLTLRYSPGSETMFQGIFKLLPGHALLFKKGKLDVKPFWHQTSFREEITGSIREVDALIESAVRSRSIADVPVGIFLSGGLDSSTLVAYMSRFTKKFKTFSIGFGGETDETQYAQLVAKKFKTEHIAITLKEETLSLLPEVVSHLDEPLADPACLPTYQLCKEVRKHVKVALSGEGGDEVFGGYHTYNVIPYLKKMILVPRIIRKGIAPFLKSSARLLTYPHKQELLLLSEMANASKTIHEAHEHFFYFPFTAADKKNLFSNSVLRKVDLDNPLFYYTLSGENLYLGTKEYYFREWLPNDLLMKVDKMSMAHGLEVRPPFLDLNLIHYFARLKESDLLGRSLFRKTVANQLPSSILKRKKQGFTLPLSTWFSRKGYVSRFKPHFEKLSSRGYFNKNALMGILENNESFKNDHRIWTLLNFEIWCKIYLDGINPKSITL